MSASGLVTWKAEGKTNITASAGGKTATLALTCQAAPAPPSGE